MRPKVKLYGILVESQRELEVIADMFWQPRLQIALRKALEELPQRVVLTCRNHRSNAVQQRWINGRVVADFIDAAIHEVGGRHVKLPQVFGFPRCEGFGV